MRRRVVVPLSIALVLGVLGVLAGTWVVTRDDRGDERPPERWRFDTGSAATLLDYAVAAGDRVYVGVSRDSHGVLVALDAASGAERWRFAPS